MPSRPPRPRLPTMSSWAPEVASSSAARGAQASQPPEGGPPLGALLRGHPPVTGDVGAGAGQLGELADLVQNQVRIGRCRGFAYAAVPDCGVQLGLDALPQCSRSAPVQVPQHLRQRILTQRRELGEELVPVHPPGWHGRTWYVGFGPAAAVLRHCYGRPPRIAAPPRPDRVCGACNKSAGCMGGWPWRRCRMKFM
jgi:hypothetical protein